MQTWQLTCIAIGFTLGIGVCTVTEVGLEVVVWMLLVGFAVVAIWRRNRGAISAPVVLTLSLVIVFCAFGALRTHVHTATFGHSVLTNSLNTEITVLGTIVREPDYRERTVHLYTRVENDLILVTTDRLASLEYGDKISITGKLTQPESFTTDLGRTFNYPGYLLAKGVEYQISFAEVTKLSSGDASKLLSWLFTIKHALMDTIETAIPEPQAGLGEGLLLGVKQALGAELENDFRRTGIIHIVVLSGYNVMLVVAFVMYILSYFFKPKLRFLFGITAIIAFALIVGLSATVVRASVMAAMLLFAQTFGRHYDVFRALIFTGCLMLVVNPYLLIYDIGFQLSFMATVGLLMALPHFETDTTNMKFKWKDYLIATVATQIAVLPLLIFHIGEVSFVAVFVNLLVLPVVPLAMFLTFLAGVVGLLFQPSAVFIGYGAFGVLSYIIVVAENFAALPFATSTLPSLSPVWVLVMYIFLYTAWYRFFSTTNDNDRVSEWTIIEEKESAVDRRSTAPESTPIFFR